MERILIEEARRRKLRERAVVVLGAEHGAWHVGGDRRDSAPLEAELTLDVVALSEALEVLDKIDPRATQIVRFRVFMGLTVDQTARLMDLSDRTVKRDWLVARAWLFQRIQGEKAGVPSGRGAVGAT
jgi:DNA-directed RNA polymerase specialized sigma24 family protein